MRQGWFFQEASATKALTKDKLPILLIHGSNDTYVPTSMVYENYKAVKKKERQKNYWLSKGLLTPNHLKQILNFTAKQFQNL